MRVIEIIRTHKWERFPESNAKLFRCKRCDIFLEIRTLRDKRWREMYERALTGKVSLFKNVYLFDWIGNSFGFFMDCNFNEDISKKHSCTYRIMERALR